MRTKNIVAALVLFFALTSAAFGEVTINVNGEYEYWEPDFGDTSSAPVLGIGLGYHSDRWYGGLGYSLGNYAIEGASDDTLTRRDFDFSFGYYLMSNLSVFAGYHYGALSFEHDLEPAESIDERSQGLGIGATMHQFITERWVGYETVSVALLYTTTEFDSMDDTGWTRLLNLEAGLLYRFSANFNAAASIKYQPSQVNYDELDSRSAYFVRGGLNLNYAF